MKLTSTLTLPPDTACRTLAVVAQKGSGKTYTGMKLFELMFTAGNQLVAIDPTGVWWGLRAAGRGPGLDLIIMGGLHGDVPLEATAGELVAEFINDTGRSVVLDLSEFESKASQNRFLLAFANKLYHLKSSNRTPLHFMLDEADQYAPQKPLPGEQALLGAFERIVRLGRSRGMGMTMITQRGAVLNKNLLTQVDALICHRIVGKQDLDAMIDWMRHYTPGDGTLLRCQRELPQQGQGEMWCWSPNWLNVFQPGKVLSRQTFDSSATPETGKPAQQRAKLRDVDLTALTEQIRATQQKAVENDPKALKQRVQALEKELAELKAKPQQPFLSDMDRELIGRLPGLELIRITPVLQRIADAFAPQSSEPLYRIGPAVANVEGLKRVQAKEAAQRPGKTYKPGSFLIDGVRVPPVKLEGLKPAQQRILDALAFYESIGIMTPSLLQVGVVATLDASGGHFSNLAGPLSSGGLVVRQNGTMQLTAEGRRHARVPDNVGNLDEYHDMLCERARKVASNKTAEMLRVIIEQTGRVDTSTPCEAVGRAVGIDHTGGHFSNTIGPLSTLGLIRRAHGNITATEILFPNLP